MVNPVPPPPWSGELAQRAARIRLLALDVDGVLTDGGLYLDDAGLQGKRFHVRDGLGMRLLREAGLQVGIITARKSKLVEQRAEELKLAFVRQGAHRKWAALEEEMNRAGLTPEACAYMGDDLVDLGVLTRVGLAAAPADAHPEVAARVHWQASTGGGRGAVRELAEGILHAQGAWEGIVARMLDP